MWAQVSDLQEISGHAITTVACKNVTKLACPNILWSFTVYANVILSLLIYLYTVYKIFVQN